MAPPTPPSRSQLADATKAIGIVLVVWGHAPGITPWVGVVIYSMHMPLFFFVSGYLLKTERLQQPLSKQCRDLARTLLSPYVLFFVISLAYWLATRNLGARAAKFTDVTVLDAVTGLATGLSRDLFVNLALWFFPCMFVTQLLYRLAWKACPREGWLALASGLFAVGLLTTTLPWSSRLPWGLDIAFVAVVFFAIGRWVRVAPVGQWLESTAKRSIASPLLVAVPVWLAGALYQGRVDLAMASFGPSVLLYFVAATSGIAAVLGLASSVRLTSAGQWLADNTLLIFPLHALFINLGSGVAKMFGIGPYGLGWSVGFVAWSLACCVPSAILLKRYCAPLLGMQTSRSRSPAFAHY
nr:acyltransferase family protein [Variovorax boronicumulans]